MQIELIFGGNDMRLASFWQGEFWELIRCDNVNSDKANNIFAKITYELYFLVADASSQQGFIADTFIRSSYWSRIKRCSANREWYFRVLFCWSSKHHTTFNINLFTGLFCRMAGSNGNFFTVYCSAMLPFFRLCWGFTTPAYSRSFWSTHHDDWPGCFWNPRHQNKCMGRWI